MSKPNLIIKLNDYPLGNECPLCGQLTNPNIGAELFTADTDEIVCLDCGMKHAPILSCLITFADFARALDIHGNPLLAELLCFAELSELLQKAEIAFGDKWEYKEGFTKSPMNTYQDFGFQG